MHILQSQSETTCAGISQTLMQVAATQCTNSHQPVQPTILCRYFLCKGTLTGEASTVDIRSVLWELRLKLGTKDGQNGLNHTQRQAASIVHLHHSPRVAVEQGYLGCTPWLINMHILRPSSERFICAQLLTTKKSHRNQNQRGRIAANFNFLSMFMSP